VGAEVGLADGADALRLLDDRGAIGKIVVAVRS
jgi:hypothetical protein